MDKTNAYGRAISRVSKFPAVLVLTSAVAGCFLEPVESNVTGGPGVSNAPPTFTSAASANVVEGSPPSAYVATAADPDNDPLSFSLAGGVDQALFIVDALSGDLSFRTSPDFENPSDNDGDNRYLVDLQVDDGNGGSANLALTISVTNVNEAPVFDSGTLTIVPENSNSTYTANATDPDLDTITYSLAGGVDLALFSIDAASGALTFNNLPDFEVPLDNGADNDYAVQIDANDGNGAISRMSVNVRVTDISQLQVEISFPTPNANLGAVAVTEVTGNLLDLEDGVVEFNDVASLTVNGVAALQSLADPSRWSAQIPIAALTDSILVSAQATSGTNNISAIAVENELMIVRPDLIAQDTANDRVLVVDSVGEGALVSVDLQTGARAIIADVNTGSGADVIQPEDVALDLANNRLFVIDFFLRALISVDLTSGDRVVISDALTGTGPVFSDPLSITLDAAANRVLVLDADLAALIAVDPGNGNRNIVSDSVIGAGPAMIIPTAVEIDTANNRALVGDFALEAIVAIDLVSGDRTVLADAATGAGISFPIAMTLDPATGRLLVVDLNRAALLSIDLLTGAGTVLSDAGTGLGSPLSFPRAIALDATRDRALVVDIARSEILDVNLTSGDRLEFADSDTGVGPDIPGTTAAALDAVSNRVLVTELNGEGAGLVWVDLSNADRTILANTNTGSGPDFDFLTALALDVPNNRALVLDDTLDALISVDLVTGNRSIVADQFTGSGALITSPTSIALDIPNNRALIADDALDALVWTDLSSGTRTVLTAAGTGAGPLITAPSSVVLDVGGNRVLVVDSDLNALLSVDLTSGDRTVLSDAVTGVGDVFIAPLSVALDSVNSRALVADGNGNVSSLLFWVDLISGDRSLITDSDSDAGPLLQNVQMAVLDLAQGRAFAVDIDLESLLIIELNTGQRAVVSR